MLKTASGRHTGTPLVFLTEAAARHWFALILAGLVIGLTCLYFLYAERVVPPWDPTSMVILGKSLAQNQDIQFQDAHNALVGPYFNPHGFSIRAPHDANPYSVFPPGLSLLLALLFVAGGEGLIYLVPPFFGALGLAAAAYIAYCVGGRWASLFAVLLLGTSRVAVTFATSLWSDGPSLGLLLLGVALYLRATRAPKPALYLAGGVLLGAFVLFKFVNVAFAALILAHCWLTCPRRSRFYATGLLAAGIGLGAAGMLVYQAEAYGSPLANAYAAWGKSLYDFPLFSPKYLFVQSPAPWQDISGRAIVSGILRDMHLWAGLALIAPWAGRKGSWKLLLAAIAGANILLYAVSVFTPRQFINMRYLLPALAAGYLLAATLLGEIVVRLRSPLLRTALVLSVFVLATAPLLAVTLPDLRGRNAGSAHSIEMVLQTRSKMGEAPVVLAYNLADSFILYGQVSVLNYRRVEAADLATRNALVLQAVDDLVCMGKRVYLVEDDEAMFGTVYPELAQRFVLQPVAAPLTTFEIIADASDSC